VQSKRLEQQASVAIKYNFKLDEADYTAALEAAANTTLENCSNAGYDKVFYDGLRIITATQNNKAATSLHNSTYDIFIRADGTQYKLTAPLGLELVQDPATEAYIFEYENSTIFEDEQIALLAIEVIVADNNTEALLSVRAFDIQTQQLISSVLYYISDVSEMLSTATSTQTTETVQASESLSTNEESIDLDGDIISATDDSTQIERTIPTSVSINDTQQLIQKLSNISTPYTFETTAVAETPAQSILVADLLKDTLLKNSELILTEGNYIQRTYLPTDANSVSTATAILVLKANEDDYTLFTKALENDRTLEIGTMSLNLPE
jgi:hypothetical protein